MRNAARLHQARETRDDDDVNRNILVTVRLTADERKAWQAAADDDKRKLGDWIRIVCNAQIKPTKKAGK